MNSTRVIHPTRLKTSLLIGSILLLLAPRASFADEGEGGYGESVSSRRGFAVGFGPIGNIFLIDTTPVLDPGVGGWLYFDYRFQENFAFETSFFITTQEGANVSGAEGSILLLGMPTFDLKYYFLNHPHWDPFASTGVGVYFLTEGSVGNSTGGVGLGAHIGLGFDYHLTRLISVGFQGTFRSIGLITDFGTPSVSVALFPYSLQGNVGFHF